jgi:beta-lactamase regulating signal transducer with metallopeptidase domain
MGVIIDNFDPVARLVLQAMLNSLWQGMIIAGLVYLMLRTIKHLSATTRYAVWLVSLLTIGILPLMAIKSRESSPSAPAAIEATAKMQQSLEVDSAFSDRVHKPIAEESFRVLRPAPVSPQTKKRVDIDQYIPPRIDESARFVSFGESSKVVQPGGSIPSISPKGSKPARLNHERLWGGAVTGILANLFKGWMPLILICSWLIGSVVMLGRVADSYLFLFRLRRQLGFVPSAQRLRMHRLAEIFGIRRQVRLFSSPLVSMPMTIGAFKPLVILPTDFARNLSENEFDSVIAHELAHIKRWDYLTNLLQRMVQACLFFHPAVWFISKQLMIERELACDDWAVKTCEPGRYANCLTKLIELLRESKPFAAAAGIFFGKNVISRRVEMILNRNRNATTAVSKPALVYAICTAVLFVGMCSRISPVIAVPLGQNRAAKKPEKAETKTKQSAPSKIEQIPATPAPSARAAAEFKPDLPKAVEPPQAPEPTAAVAVEPDDEIFTAPTVPSTAFVPPRAVTVSGSNSAPTALTDGFVAGFGNGIGAGFGTGAGQSFVFAQAAPSAPQAPAATAITPRPAPAPVAVPGWDQDDKSKTTVIPESELLAVLTDIVKRDADPSVRNEALQGIYRMRSDNGINTLIQLYDGVSDVKVKSEIIGYLLRRNGDNSKAITKLMSIAKSEKDEELRNRAIRALGGVKGDEGANNLIQIYDGLQDQKMKQYVIRSLATNKSRKAIDKLIQIAKSDTDPTIRQSAIRGLYGIDNRLYLDFIDKNRPKISIFDHDLQPLELKGFELLDTEKLKRDLDQLKFEWPEMEFNFKNLENEWNLEQLPEWKRKIERIERVKPRIQRNGAPVLKLKRGQSAKAI